MDFSITPQQQLLKNEFWEFFEQEAKNAPEGWLGGMGAPFETDANWAYHVSVGKKLGEKGWVSLAWPKAYGGNQLGHVEQVLFSEMRAYYRIPGTDLGPSLLAACLLEHASEEMKKEWLPRIASRETTWCQGWSEPDAGSDLASLTTTATEDGDDYVINGKKIWTSGAHRTSHIFLLARTDPNAPKHNGITFFIGPMDKPGIEVRPILSMHGKPCHCEVFLDNLRIPKRNVVGQVNNGWNVTMSGMDFERSAIQFIAEAQRDLDDLVAFCKENDYGVETFHRKSGVGMQLAQLLTEVEAARRFAYYIAWLQSNGHNVPAETSANKTFATELLVRVAHTGLEVLGLYGTLKGDSNWAKLQGRFEYVCQYALGPPIAAGTHEIQKNIIARMGLGLPRT